MHPPGELNAAKGAGPLSLGPFNPLDPAHFLDPFERLAELRRTCPVSQSAPGQVFVATDAEARRVLFDSATFSNRGNFQLEGEGAVADPPTVVQLDPPRHGEFRRLIMSAFSPLIIARTEPRIRDIAGDLVDGFSARGTAEIMSAFASPLPAQVIAHVIGVPEQDSDRFIGWTRDITARVPRSIHDLPAWVEFTRYLEDLIERRAGTTDPPDDFVTRLIRAEADGVRLSPGEIRMSIFQLIIAGNDTTSRLIGNCLYELLRERGRWERIARDPSLIPIAVEESLRHDSPIQWVMRRCEEAGRVGDVVIDEGERVLVGIGSANRDSAVRDLPEDFSLERATSEHLAFGHGRHFCLGAALGRLEALVALETLVRRLPGLRLAEGFTAQIAPSAMMRGPQRLDVCW